MKKTTILLVLLFFVFNGFSSNNSKSSYIIKDSSKNVNKIEVYYFHYKHRCSTCLAVEEQTRNDLIDIYPVKMNSGEITFQSVDMEEKSGEDLANKLKVKWQTLIFIHKDQRTDLTNDAFLYATTKPDKLKVKIKEIVDKMLKLR